MERSGEQFLHQKDSKLHTSPAVEGEMNRQKKRGEQVSQKPADKLAGWMSVLERTHLGHRDDPRVLERIKKAYHKDLVIKPENIPESYYENQQRLAREQGHGDIEITDEMRRQHEEVIIADQKSTLDNWLKYFTCPDSDVYPMWTKYWAFAGMTKLSTFDKEKHTFGKRRKDTVAPFPDLNREALAYVVDAVIKKVNKENIPADADNLEFQKLVQGANFGKLYAWAIEKVTPTEENELVNTKGEWIKRNQGSDHMPLVESLQGHGTGWCTAGESTAKSQLGSGDFYTYYSYDKTGKPTIPRIAIRMEGNKIAEVRGIASDQNMDPHIAQSGVLEEKLAEFGTEGEKYQKKSADMKRLTEIEKRIKSDKDGELTKDDLKFLYEFDSKIEGFGYQKDPRIAELLDGRDVKDDISNVAGCSRDQISLTKEEALSGDIKYHYQGLYLESLTSAEGLKLPGSVGGSLDLSGLTSAEGLKLPGSVGGSLDLSGLTSAEGLKLPGSVGGDLNLRRLTSAE
ncbi:hypothetical protein KJ785_02975, partial [Patescibacteria group bacterium]|nr:hypothetical protein [Patescibacteria group bacterium]